MRLLRRIGGALRDGWLIVGVTLIMLAGLEATAAIGIAARQAMRVNVSTQADRRVAADTYADSPWANGYFQEYHQSSDVEWASYYYWHRRPFAGEYINVGQDGVRHTPQGEAAPAAGREPAKVFMFGGSTMWGTGARDTGTIPAGVAAGLASHGIAAEVRNYGETGLVSTQELIRLQTLLSAGDVPDLVVFYDGVNDVFSSFQQQRAGLPQNEFNRRREFNFAERATTPEVLSLALRRSATARVLKYFQDRLRRPNRVPRRRVDDDSLATATAEAYAANVRQVKALAAAYGFEALFFLQPTVFDKPQLTAYESGARAEMAYLEEFIGKAYPAIRTRLGGEPAFGDLSGVFGAIERPVFIDWCHLGEAGNGIVAAAITKAILDRTAGGALAASRAADGL